MPLICCPACTFNKETAAKKIPTGDTRITCPHSQHQFFLKFPPPVILDPNTQAESTELHEVPFTFTGKEGEYFGVWIVNTLLKIVTLGFYSPWAKFRKRRYFFGHTFHNQLKLGKFFGIIVSNMFAISFSAWLLVPWAAVRMIRYRVGTLSLIAMGSLEHSVAGKQDEVSAIGEEIGDIFDIEIGL